MLWVGEAVLLAVIIDGRLLQFERLLISAPQQQPASAAD